MALCSGLEEVKLACARRSSFDIYIVDNFSPTSEAFDRLELMSGMDDFKQVLLLGCYSESEQERIYKWAWSKRVGLLGIVEKPVTLSRLHEALDGLPLLYDCNGAVVQEFQHNEFS